MASEESELKFDLTTVPLPNLMAEIYERHSRFLFVGINVKDEVHLCRRGYAVDALGLAEYARVRLHELMRGDDGSDGDGG